MVARIKQTHLKECFNPKSGANVESPLPLGERDRVRGRARTRAMSRAFQNRRLDDVARQSDRACRRRPLTLSLSPKGRGDSVAAPRWSL